MTGDYVTTGGQETGFFASVPRHSNGSFADAQWTEIAFASRSASDVTVTSGKTVIDNHVLGIYADSQGTSSYLATVNNRQQITNRVAQTIVIGQGIIGSPSK